MSEKIDTVVRPKIAPKLDLQPPPLYKVIYINDHTTPMEFVIETLKIIFEYGETEAEDITRRIHEEGSSVVALLPYEIAEQKGIEVTLLARNNGFPLQVKLEPDN
jgi:ATP-dependent Clp protease adaptor protein ClpS